MRYLKSYTDISEALLPSQFRKYVSEFNRERYSEIFKKYKDKYSGDKNAYRIYIPIIKNGSDNTSRNEIEKVLTENGYEILDYINGSCKFKDAKNPSKIGQVLTKLKQDDLMKKFIEDPNRKAGKNLIVCISRHPYDIAGSDTDRKWSNCMTIGNKNSKKIDYYNNEIKKLKDKKEEDPTHRKYYYEIEEIKDKISNIKSNGVNIKYLLQDVKEGSLIAYLIKEEDKNINNPIANLNIKPYINITDKNDIILVSDLSMYGNGTEEFKNTVDSWLKEVNGVKGEGLYKLSNKLYNDNDNDNILIGDSVSIIKKIIDSGILNIESLNFILDTFDETDKKNKIDALKLLSLIDKKLITQIFSREHSSYYITRIIRLMSSFYIDSRLLIDILSRSKDLDFHYSEYDDIFNKAINENNIKVIEILNDYFDLPLILIEGGDFESLIKYLSLFKIKYETKEKKDYYAIKIHTTPEKIYKYYRHDDYKFLKKNSKKLRYL